MQPLTPSRSRGEGRRLYRRQPVRMALNKVSCPRGDSRTSSVASEGFRLPLASRAGYSPEIEQGGALGDQVRRLADPAPSSSTVQPVEFISA